MSIASCTSTVLPSQTLFLQRLKSLRMGSPYHLHDSSIVTGRLSNLPATFPWPSSTHRDSCHTALDGHSMSLSAGHAANHYDSPAAFRHRRPNPAPRERICAPSTPITPVQLPARQRNSRRRCNPVHPRPKLGRARPSLGAQPAPRVHQIAPSATIPRQTRQTFTPPNHPAR